MKRHCYSDRYMRKVFRNRKYVELMLDYYGTGIWMWHGHNSVHPHHIAVPLEYLPVSQEMRDHINQIQRDFDRGKFDDEMNYIFPPDIDSDFTARLVNAAHALAEELDGWEIVAKV